MNIKSLLLGSAAALVAVSGAQAADAVVAAEPEPMEYVKVCDAYGTGYFYIPGTETCLKVGGRVRFDVNFKDKRSVYGGAQAKGYATKARAELYLDSASDTEYGALKTHITARWDEGAGGIYDEGHANLIAAYIQIAGFTIGEADSAFSTFTGYAGNVDNDDLIPYGDFEVNQITYLYDAGTGFSATIGLQDDHRGNKAGVNNAIIDRDHGNSYYPDVIAGAGYSAGAFSFKAVGGYDTSLEQGAIKARVDGTFGMFSAFLMGGWSSNKAGNAFSFDDGTPVAWGDWAVWTGASAKISDDLSVNLQGSFDDFKTAAVVGNVQWNPVKDLLIMPEVRWSHFDSDAVGKGHNTLLSSGVGDQWSGMLRFQRTF